MTEAHDPQLLALFEEANTDLASKDFTQRVMLDLRRSNRRDTLIEVSCYVAALAFMWLLAPYIQSVSQVIAALPGDGMALLTESIQSQATFPLTYILALPFMAYAIFRRYWAN